ncbi:MAG: hypothetical protein ABSG05_02335 [Candidatus Pacearchaeota archaeon]|jgi:hypothetical protein
MYNNLRKNKKAQVGDTMTWVVATIIIIIILGISIFIASNYLGNIKKITTPSGQTYDIPIAKSFYSYLLTKNDAGQSVYSQLQADKNLNDFNGNLSLDLFNGQRKIKTYQGAGIEGTLLSVNTVWVGVMNYTTQSSYGIVNKYFGSQGVKSPTATDLISESFWLDANQNQSINLIVTNNPPTK